MFVYTYIHQVIRYQQNESYIQIKLTITLLLPTKCTLQERFMTMNILYIAFIEKKQKLNHGIEYSLNRIIL